MITHVVGPSSDFGLEFQAVTGEQGSGRFLEAGAITPH